MKVRGFIHAGPVLCAIALFLFVGAGSAPSAHAQARSGLDVADEDQPSGTDEPEETPPRAIDPDAPPPGADVMFIVAGESEAAAAYAQSDSVTGFNAADIEALGALSVADLADFTPNLEIVTAGATTPTFFIRGVGLNDFNSNSSGAVAIFQDGVAVNAPALQLPVFFDVENVDIERGPVGKGAARNASAGAIRVYSRKPKGSYNGFLRSSYGNYNYNDFEGAVEAPLYEDILMGRIAFRSSQRDGFQKNGCGALPPKFDFNGNPLRAQLTFLDGIGISTTRAPWSLCGERVERRGFTGTPDGYSPIPAGLPTEVNDLGIWATRMTLRFQPTLDQDWILNGHVAKRSEYSRLGISYGTRGGQRFPDGSTIDGRLGAGDGQSQEVGGFIRPVVTRMIEERAALITGLTGTSVGARDQALISTANDIGLNLDQDAYTGYYNKVGDTRNLTYGGYLRGEIALPADLTFTTITGYEGYDRFIDSDTDQSPNVLFEITTDDAGWQVYQNLDLAGGLEDLPIEWNVGGYYLQEHLDVQIFNDFGKLASTGGVSNRDYTQDTWSFGVYGGFEWSFWDDLTLDGGVRYNWDKKAIDYELSVARSSRTRSTVDDQTRNAPTGQLRLTYNFRDDTHAYWKYTRGWKGGHYNATSSLLQGVSFAEPEENNAYETGLRGSWFDNKLGMNLSFFLYDYTNYQLFTVQNDFSSNPEFVVINASDVQVYGSEVELTARPFDDTSVTARFGWLESRFIDFVQTQVVQESTDQGIITREIDLNYSGNRLLNSPQFTFSISAEHTVHLGRYGSITGRYDGTWQDVKYFDPTEGRGLPNRDGQLFLPEGTIGQQAFWLHSLLFIYRPPIGNVTIEAYVRNLTDEIYKSFAFDASQFQRTSIYFTGEPRMFGATLAVSF